MHNINRATSAGIERATAACEATTLPMRPFGVSSYNGSIIQARFDYSVNLMQFRRSCAFIHDNVGDYTGLLDLNIRFVINLSIIQYITMLLKSSVVQAGYLTGGTGWIIGVG